MFQKEGGNFIHIYEKLERNSYNFFLKIIFNQIFD